MTIEQILRNDPLFVGFDKLFDRAASASRVSNTQKYPPYNIIKTGENAYLIEIAVAGFDEEDFDIELHDGILTVKADVSTTDDDAEYIFKGIAARSFERSFTLADTIVVESASLHQGMLTVRLKNVIPDEKKPRKISIGKSSNEQLLTG